MSQPDILFIMTDQQRFDTIAALGNRHIYTPNIDRLVHRGLTFTNAYTPCPVCVAARYSLHTGSLPPTTRVFDNSIAPPAQGQPPTMTGRCGPFLGLTMRDLGYRTFGIGKFHTTPYDEDLGFDVHLHSEELYDDPAMRRWDKYAAFIDATPFGFIEALMGERTEMYYMPQMSPLPAELTVEAWAADRAVEQIRLGGSKPSFGFVSFIGPHPPLAPPIPFNRMYDPDRMTNPIKGDRKVDHMDEQIPFMNHAIWAEDITDSHARVLKARYYGEITYIDQCLGRILDAVEARGNAENTLICFFADHGDHMGDHHAWQKESFFEASVKVPFLLSWPQRLPAGERRSDLVGLQDLFAIATGAAGAVQTREGMDVLGMLAGGVKPRKRLVSYYGKPGTSRFKLMVRYGPWKYIYIANGGREQLFDLKKDPQELKNLARPVSPVLVELREAGIAACQTPGASAALNGKRFRKFSFAPMKRVRIHQFDRSRGIEHFPDRPEDLLRGNFETPHINGSVRPASRRRRAVKS